MDFLNDFFRHPLSHPFVLTPLAFLLGTIVGSMLNVCILRLPLEKSIFWPSSHCGSCLRAIRFRDNLPIIGYLRLKGKCRHCGVPFSSRYMWIELFTGLMFAGTFLFYVTLNLHGGQGMAVNPFAPTREGAQMVMGVGPWVRLSFVGMWLGHIFLLCCLLVTTFTDIDYQEIPLRTTIFGTVVGILCSALMPWAWPCNPEIIKLILERVGTEPLPAAMQMWPWWLPSGMQDTPAPYSVWMGLLNGVLGAAFGTGLIRGIRFIFGWGFGKEAMGLGDADLMMMIGAFLGWQAVILVLIYAVFLGLGYAVYMILFARARMLPFGPFIAGGVVLTLYLGPVLAWLWDPKALAELKVGIHYLFFFNPMAISLICVLSVVLAFSMAFVLRLLRLVRLAPRHAEPPKRLPKPQSVPVPEKVSAPEPVLTAPVVASVSATVEDKEEEQEEETEKQTASAPSRKKGKKKRKK